MLAVDFIVETLVGYGIDTFFVLTGGAVAPLVDAIARNANAKLHCFQHEQAASMAVDGYYRATGQAACVAVTSGPGVQNVLNGVCGCFYDSVPALFISGQVNMRESLDAIHAKPRQVGFQETPVIECFRPFTKYIQKIRSTNEVAFALREAVRMMQGGRKGPSLLDIPVDVQMSTLEDCTCLVLGCGAYNTKDISCVDGVDMNHVVHLVRSAVRPVILLGNGARNARQHVVKLLQCLHVPFTTSWGGLDLVPLSAVEQGMFLGAHGVYGDRVANFALQNADLLLVLGARLDTRQTGGNLEAFSTQSKKIMVDIDADEINKLLERGVNIAMGCKMDVGDFISQLLLLESMRKPADIAEWRNTMRQWIADYGVEKHAVFDGFVSPYELLLNLNGMLPSDAAVVVDTGATLVWAFQTLRAHTYDQRIFSNLGNSSMGYALPAAIGAAIGAPLRPIICIVGDGGFQQNIQELSTAAHYNLNIKVVILNNNGYGIIKQFQNSYLGGRHVATCSEDLYGVERKGVNFASVARAYGVPAQRITSCDQLTRDLFTAPGLAVYDVVIHELHGIEPKTDFGNSLENMSPYIESAAAMIVPAPPRLTVTGWVKL